VVLKKHGRNTGEQKVQTRAYDPLLSQQTGVVGTKDAATVAAERRRRVLEQPIPGNRARVEGGVGTYTIAPVSNLSNVQGGASRRMGASGDDAFRRIAARGAVKSGTTGKKA
jgi:transcription factor SPN1